MRLQILLIWKTDWNLLPLATVTWAQNKKKKRNTEQNIFYVLEGPRHERSVVSPTTIVGESTSMLEVKAGSIDIIPSDFLKAVFTSVENDLLQIVNSSLASGIFPSH